MSSKNPDNKPDLLEAVDSLLGEIEETAQSFASPKKEAVDLGAQSRNVEEGVSSQRPAPDAEDTGETSTTMDSAAQALEAMDALETQAEDLVAMGVDALLQEAESDTEAPSNPESMTDSSDERSADDSQELLASIDQLLEESRESVDGTLEPSSTQTATEPVEESDAEHMLEADPDQLAESDIPAEPETPLDSEVIEEPSDDIDELDESSLIIETTVPSNGSAEVSMDLLDSALAEAADDMLEGDFETEEGELVSGDPAVSEMEEAIKDPSNETSSDPAGGDGAIEQAVDSMLGADDQYASPPGSITHADETPTESPDSVVDLAQESTHESSEEPPTAYEAEHKTTTTPSDPEASQADHAAVSDPVVQSELDALESVRVREPIAVPAWFERTVEVVRPKIDRFDPLKGKTMDAVAMALGAGIVAVMTYAPPVLSSGMILISKPLAKQSPEIRNAVGFIALWTGFLAAVVWIYLLVFRAPIVPTPEVAPTRVINADESMIAPVINQIDP